MYTHTHISDVICIILSITSIKKKLKRLANPARKGRKTSFFCSAVFSYRLQATLGLEIYLCLWSSVNHVPPWPFWTLECCESLSQDPYGLTTHQIALLFLWRIRYKVVFAKLSVLSSERWTSQSEKTRIDQMLSFSIQYLPRQWLSSWAGKQCAGIRRLPSFLSSLPSLAPAERWPISFHPIVSEEKESEGVLRKHWKCRAHLPCVKACLGMKTAHHCRRIAP